MSDESTERLRELLGDIAERVQPVDLLDRVRVRSRHESRRRRVASGAVLVSIVAAMGVGLIQGAGRHGPQTAVPNAASSATVPPSATPSRPPAAPSASASTTGPALPVPGGIGTLFYLDQPKEVDHTIPATVYRWDSSTSNVTTVFQLRASYEAANLSVSPDGRWLSWVTMSGPEPASLRLVDLRSRQERTLLVGVEPAFSEPNWSPDSTRLLVRRIPVDPADLEATAGTVDIATGAFTPLAFTFMAVHPTWAADGSALVFGEYIGATPQMVLKVAGPDGTLLRTVPNQTAYDFDICSLSAGATHVAIHPRSSDGDVTDGNPNGMSLDTARLLYCDTIVDTRTGATLTLPVRGEIRQVKFRADGSILVRVRHNGQHRLILLSHDLTVLAERAEPASLSTYMLL